MDGFVFSPRRLALLRAFSADKFLFFGGFFLVFLLTLFDIKYTSALPIYRERNFNSTGSRLDNGHPRITLRERSHGGDDEVFFSLETTLGSSKKKIAEPVFFMCKTNVICFCLAL